MDLRIYINGILHFILEKEEFVLLQSWYMNKTDCRITIYAKTRDIALEYNSVEKWKTVLKILDENL